MTSIVTALLAALVLAILSGKLFIPFLVKLKVGQSIREVGPSWHMKKAGTPTMGGIIFMFAALVAILITGFDFEKYAVFTCGLLFGLVGFVDDYIKVVKKRNLGLSALQKFSAQFLIALCFVLFMYATSRVDTFISVPFLLNEMNLSYFYMPFAVFVILAVVNSVNLTDGLDGLAATVTAIVAAFFAFFAYKHGFDGICVALAAVVGGLLGFLVYNRYPAKVFMGDTGSLFLGGILAASVVIMGVELAFVIAGFIFFLETLSVVLQVLCYKLTGKRIFKMAPIHHHFEKCGWNEVKIVTVFSLVTIILCLIAWMVC